MGGEGLERIIKERRRKRIEAIQLAKKFVKCVSKYFNIMRAYLIGSYARGDFNIWSDIDVILIVDSPPESPLKRLDTIKDCLLKYPSIEPIIIGLQDYERLKKKNNPIVVEIERYGVKLL